MVPSKDSGDRKERQIPQIKYGKQYGKTQLGKNVPKKVILICEDSDKIQRNHRFRNAGGEVLWKGQQCS